MSKSKAPSIPAAPSFQADPNVGWSQETLKGQVPKLLSLEGLPPLLQETIETNPEITNLTLQRLQASLEPSYRLGMQNITNTLEANNQLTGSTTASALGNYNSDYLAALTAAGAEAGIADINRALSNRISLYGSGLNTAQAIGNTGLNNQNQMNQFALQNYENQVAAALLSQPQQRGGLMGGLTGAIGGGLGAFALGGGNPYVSALGVVGGGLAGGFGPSGTGGQFLNAGAGLAGSRFGATNSLISSSSGESIYNPIYQPQSSGSRLLGPISNYYPY